MIEGDVKWLEAAALHLESALRAYNSSDSNKRVYLILIFLNKYKIVFLLLNSNQMLLLLVLL